MKNLTHVMKDMNITNSFKASVFLIWVKISQVVAFGGLGEDHNISLATERWKINNRWKTPLVVRCIAKLFTTIGMFFKQQSEVVKTTDRRASSERHRNCGGNAY